MEVVEWCTVLNILLSTVCIQETYDMFEMNGELDKKKKKKIKKKERLEGMKKEMDIVSDGPHNRWVLKQYSLCE